MAFHAFFENVCFLLAQAKKEQEKSAKHQRHASQSAADAIAISLKSLKTLQRLGGGTCASPHVATCCPVVGAAALRPNCQGPCPRQAREPLDMPWWLLLLGCCGSFHPMAICFFEIT